jgi:hypothetical protein
MSPNLYGKTVQSNSALARSHGRVKDSGNQVPEELLSPIDRRRIANDLAAARLATACTLIAASVPPKASPSP